MESRCNSEVPTRTRIKALLKISLLNNFYPSRLIIGLGIAQTVCGVTISIFGMLTYPLEASSSPSTLYYGMYLWIGLIIIVSGLIGFTSGRNGLSVLLLKINFFTSIFATAAIAFVSILAGNSFMEKVGDKDIVLDINRMEMSERWRPPDLAKPTVVIHMIIFVLSSCSCLLSLINFWLCARAVFKFHHHAGSSITIMGLKDTTESEIDCIKRRDRIVSWIIEQSTQVQDLPANLSPYVKCDFPTLKPSASTASTRLFSYGPSIP